MELIWNSFKNVKPLKDGFYLMVMEVKEVNKRFFDIAAFKDRKWKFNVCKRLYPIDINNLNRDWVGFQCKPLMWSELPDVNLLRIIDIT